MRYRVHGWTSLKRASKLRYHPLVIFKENKEEWYLGIWRKLQMLYSNIQVGWTMMIDFVNRKWGFFGPIVFWKENWFSVVPKDNKTRVLENAYHFSSFGRFGIKKTYDRRRRSIGAPCEEGLKNRVPLSIWTYNLHSWKWMEGPAVHKICAPWLVSGIGPRHRKD